MSIEYIDDSGELVNVDTQAEQQAIWNTIKPLYTRKLLVLNVKNVSSDYDLWDIITSIVQKSSTLKHDIEKIYRLRKIDIFLLKNY